MHDPLVIALACCYTTAALILAWHCSIRAKTHDKSARRHADAALCHLQNITRQASNAAASEANAARSDANCERWAGIAKGYASHAADAAATAKTAAQDAKLAAAKTHALPPATDPDGLRWFDDAPATLPFPEPPRTFPRLASEEADDGAAG